MFKIEHNVKTGEITQVDLTAEEIAIIATLQFASEAAAATKVTIDAAAEAEATAKAAAKAALLTKLGITEDEAQLLLS